MVDNRESILSFIRQNGPILPAAIAKHLAMSNLMASAHLAEMSATGKLKVSNLKIGSSPLYLIPGQESLLEKFSESLQEKDKRAYDLLKEAKVLNDRELDPLTRVALRNIKDFAIGLNVSHDGTEELFWKWHSLSNGEVEHILKEMSKDKEERAQPIRKKEQSAKEERQKVLPPTPMLKKEQPDEQPISAPPPLAAPTSMKKEKKEKIMKWPDEFAENIAAFFSKNKITIKEQNVLKKGAEMDYVLGVPSAFGQLEYYCRAKNKKKLTDSDVSNAYVQGQFRKLPVILLSTGELTKKGAEILGSLKGVTFYRIE